MKRIGNSRQKISEQINTVRHPVDPSQAVIEMGLMLGKVIRGIKLCGVFMGLLGIGLILYWLL